MTAPVFDSISMRGAVDGLPTAVPIAHQLPAVLQEDEFLLRFVAAFDDGLAPVLCTLDNLETYVTPPLAPSDFVDLLAEWVGLDQDGRWTLAQRRTLVARAVELHRRRGTAAGLADLLGLMVDGRVEVRESGGTAWSPTANARFPGDASQSVTVTVTAPASAGIDPARVSAVVAAVKPAHIRHSVEVANP